MTTSVNAWRSWHSAWKTLKRHYQIFQEVPNNNSTNFSIQPASLGRTFTLFLIDCTPPRLKIWDLFLELVPYAKNSTTGMGSRLIFVRRHSKGVPSDVALCLFRIVQEALPESEKTQRCCKGW